MNPFVRTEHALASSPSSTETSSIDALVDEIQQALGTSTSSISSNALASRSSSISSVRRRPLPQTPHPNEKTRHSFSVPSPPQSSFSRIPRPQTAQHISVEETSISTPPLSPRATVKNAYSLATAQAHAEAIAKAANPSAAAAPTAPDDFSAVASSPQRIPLDVRPEGSCSQRRDSQSSQSLWEQIQRRSFSRRDSQDSILPEYSHHTDSHTYAHVMSLQGTCVDLSSLSQVAHLLSSIIERKPLIKGSVVYPLSFTGRTLVTTLASMITQYVQVSPRLHVETVMLDPVAQRIALDIARTLKTQLFIHEADWEEHEITNDVAGVYMLYSDSLSGNKESSHASALRGVSTHLFVRSDSVHVALSATAAAACASVAERDLPSGILTPLTQCYSPTCLWSNGRACYSPSCPRRGRGFPSMIQDHEQPIETVGAKAWVELMPKDIVLTLPREEVKRQNAIHEFVQKEEVFLHDLQLLRMFADRLRSLANPMQPGLPGDAPLVGAALDVFIREVFGNLDQLLPLIARFVDELHERQREQGPVVQTIGDVVTRAALDWSSEYTAYVAHYPAALARLKSEAESNARMQRFIDDCRRHPAAARLPLDTFLFRPPARLQRYHLHLESVLKYTSEYSDDQDALKLAIEVLDEQCLIAQSQVKQTEDQLQVRDYARVLATKRYDDNVDMDLTDPRRQLVHHSRVFRRPDNFEFEWTELVAILFDNYFVLAKRKPNLDCSNASSSLRTKLVINRKPIPTFCLDMSGFDMVPVSRSSVNRYLLPSQVNEMFPFVVTHRFHTNQQPMTLYATSSEERDKWRTALQVLRCDRLPPLYNQCDLSGTAFSTKLEPSETYAFVKDAPWTRSHVTCATTWLWRDHINLLAIGTTDGVWIGRYAEPRTLRKVLHMKGVMQCAVLTPYRRFLVLADKTLIAYDLEALVPSGQAVPSVAPIRLDGARDVSFFSLGYVWGALHLVYAKRKTTETSVRILALQTSTKSDSLGHASLKGFHLVHKFYVYPEATQIQCISDGFIVSAPRAVYTYRLGSTSLTPLLAQRQRDERAHNLLKQWEGSQPLGVFHVPELNCWLACFDRGACFVNEAGLIVCPDRSFLWEVTMDSAAYYKGHVFACSPTLLEVHEAKSGRLVHLSEGHHMRFLLHTSTDQTLPIPPILLETIPTATPLVDVQRVVALHGPAENKAWQVQQEIPDDSAEEGRSTSNLF